MEFWVLIAVSAVFVGLFFFMRNERVQRALNCPLKSAEAEVDIIQRYQNPAKPVRVKTCSLLPNPKRVDCSQACVRQPA